MRERTHTDAPGDHADPDAEAAHGITTFGTVSYRQVVGCRVCGRTLLMGERSIGYFTEAGDGPFAVCELCTTRAPRFGLRPYPSTPDEVTSSRRRRPGGGIGRSLGAMRATVRVSVPRMPARRRPAPSVEEMLGAAPVGTAAIPTALAAFNESPHARTLAGLTRTLGAPKASVTPRSGTDREVILTVAWEIVWYQFRIKPDGIEQRRGTYLHDLPQRWQRWNCDVAVDGRARLAEQVDEPEGAPA